MKRGIQLLLVGALGLGAAGCYGPFNLTKKLHRWNGEVSPQKWVNEGVFLLLNIVPVYGFAALGDAIIFNSIEFWGGDNPIKAGLPSSVVEGDKQAVLKYKPEENRLRVDMFEKGRPVGTVVVAPGSDGHMVATDADGKVLLSGASAGK